MQIHVARQQQQLGVFTPEEVAAGLASGRFLPVDLAWRDGMAGWTPLGDWPEFRVAGVPASPSAQPAGSAAASLIPWEQGKSLGSFFATIKVAVTDPAVLSTGRYAFGDWLVFCYVAVAFLLPFQLTHVLLVGDQNAAFAELLGRFDAQWARDVAAQMAQTPPTPPALMVFSVFMGLAFAPLLYAGFGVAHWVGQRVCRLGPSVERTVAATLLACGVVILLGAPFQLLAFGLLTQLILSALLIAPFCVVYFRAFGAATGVNPWLQFGVSLLVWFVLFCCCCLGPILLVSGAMASVALR
ncbi:MAG: DUF4339 domain-containing protein [Verrucomicrobia bacterium]|nr:DUF4339 domain-containing protein [Verrucomicrobiota bacterium]